MERVPNKATDSGAMMIVAVGGFGQPKRAKNGVNSNRYIHLSTSRYLLAQLLILVYPDAKGLDRYSVQICHFARGKTGRMYQFHHAQMYIRIGSSAIEKPAAGAAGGVYFLYSRT